MNAVNLLPVFLVGLAGSIHCIGMCGGIVGALTAASKPKSSQAPAAVIAIVPVAPRPGPLLNIAAYNAGRIASYMGAGAVAGGLAGGIAALPGLAILQITGLWLANLMLVALGLYLGGLWSGLARLEAAVQPLWRRVQPLLKNLLPMDTPLKALVLGGLWGWVPCGMVYSVLLTAMLSGGAGSGAAVMLAFGLGTLPMLLGLGLAGARLRLALRRRGVRLACGLLILGFGLLGLLRAGAGMSSGWLDTLCLHP